MAQGRKTTVTASKLTFSVSVSPLTWNDRYLQLQSSELQNTEIKEFISNHCRRLNSKLCVHIRLKWFKNPEAVLQGHQLSAALAAWGRFPLLPPAKSITVNTLMATWTWAGPGNSSPPPSWAVLQIFVPSYMPLFLLLRCHLWAKVFAQNRELQKADTALTVRTQSSFCCT